ncbi:hypothetical protein [Streptomyces sp. NPDC056796]|uniref:hypothetical protein n=1 Tax=Streptomyces sp. NPDC056796 TaxID=3345947 RepID=UPI0036A8FD27
MTPRAINSSISLGRSSGCRGPVRTRRGSSACAYRAESFASSVGRSASAHMFSTVYFSMGT